MNAPPRTIPAPEVSPAEAGVQLAWPAEAVLGQLLDALGCSPYLLVQATRYRQSPSPAGRAAALQAIAAQPEVRRALSFVLDRGATTDLLIDLGQTLSAAPRPCSAPGGVPAGVAS